MQAHDAQHWAPRCLFVDGAGLLKVSASEAGRFTRFTHSTCLFTQTKPEELFFHSLFTDELRLDV